VGSHGALNAAFEHVRTSKRSCVRVLRSSGEAMYFVLGSQATTDGPDSRKPASN